MDGLLMRNLVVRFLVLAALWLGLAVAPAFAQFADQRNWGGTSGGAANTQTITIANFPSTPPAGVPIRAIAGFTNSGPTTLTISGGSSAKNVFKPSSAGAVALVGGEIVAGQIFEVVYDGTQYQLTSNNSQSAAFRTVPQGYLTPCNFGNSPSVSGCTAGIATPTGDVTAATTLYYGVWFGNQVPIYNGVNMVVTSITELTLTIPSSRLANTIYDVCVFLNSGTPTAAFGPAWTTSTAGSGARGTGAGTAEITQVQGLWVNAVSISGVNGASSFSIPANQCTMVGTVRIDGTNGQVSFTRTYGQSRKWAAWNFYNRLPIALQAGDGTASWTYTTSTFRPSNNNAANSLTVLVGLAEETVRNDFIQQQSISATTSPILAQSAVGWNSTSAISGTVAANSFNVGSGANGIGAVLTTMANYTLVPPIGAHTVTSLEYGAVTTAFFGTQPNMKLLSQWRG